MNVDIQFLGAAIVGVVNVGSKMEGLSPSFMARRVGELLERNLEAVHLA